MRWIDSITPFQGDVVRQLKSSGASKEVLQPELSKLLQLKQQLAAIQGSKKPTNQKQAKKAATNQKPSNKAATNQKAANKAIPTAPPEEIERLCKEVAKQVSVWAWSIIGILFYLSGLKI